YAYSALKSRPIAKLRLTDVRSAFISGGTADVPEVAFMTNSGLMHLDKNRCLFDHLVGVGRLKTYLESLDPTQQRRLKWHSRKKSSSPLGKRNTPSRPQSSRRAGRRYGWPAMLDSLTIAELRSPGTSTLRLAKPSKISRRPSSVPAAHSR